MSENLTSKILRAHLSTGNLNPGEDITVGVDQILLEDATGTTAAMQFEMLDIDTVAVPLAVVYIDHAVHGIRVNCIAPGPVYTPHVAAASMPDELQGLADWHGSRHPLDVRFIRTHIEGEYTLRSS